ICSKSSEIPVALGSSFLTEFILMGVPGILSWQHWLSLPLALLYALDLVTNTLIVTVICQEASLCQPMYCLGILAIVDMGLVITIMPKSVVILWFNAKTISFTECFAQMYTIHFLLPWSIFVCMAIDRYAAICRPLKYTSIVTESVMVKEALLMVLRNCVAPKLLREITVPRIKSTTIFVLTWGSLACLVIAGKSTALTSLSGQPGSDNLQKCQSCHAGSVERAVQCIPPALNLLVYALKNKELKQGLYQQGMFQDLTSSNSSRIQVSEFILMGFPGIHSWQHWLSLPLALLYALALIANTLIITIIYQKVSLHQPMYYFLGILAIVDMGLATTIMPKILAILWFNAKTISLPECFAQMYAIHCFITMESGIFVFMAIDRYVAICKPLRYPSIVTESFVVKATVLMVLRNCGTVMSVPVLAAQRNYCSKNQIEHCLCSNLGVTSLSCDDRKINSINQLILAWTIMGGDLGLIMISYALILQSVLKLNSAEAASKALNTCTSHLILIFFFYTVIVVLSITHSSKMKVPLIPVLLNVLHNVIPPALNPMVYALKNKDLRQGLYQMIRLELKGNH
ncbi:LOW QUALITY PROTEIN: hypothetical protein U0070_013423, partial [Myodes glareolus]